MTKLKFNIATFQFILPTREEIFEGRRHLVAPVVALVEGVHQGSAGAIYYSADELGRYPESWNGVPLPVFHPQEFGHNVSANSPEMLEAKSVGRLFNMFFDSDGAKLKGEVWIDIEKAKKIAPAVLHTIQSGGELQVSTGMWFDQDEVPGVWNGEEYESSAINVRPDHLALLPGGVGACSWGAGCGVRANKNEGDQSMEVNILGTARTPSFDGTEKTSWAGVTTTFASYRDAYYRGHGGRPEDVPNRVQDAPAALKNWIASKTLLGDGNADNEGDLIFFPVVNPSTGKLNEGALRAVISGRGSQARIPAAAKESAQKKARSLLNRHFGAKLEAGESKFDRLKEWLKSIPESLGLKLQDTSHEELKSKIQAALDVLDNEAWKHYIREIFDDYVVYEARGDNPSEVGSRTPVGKLYQRGYSVDDDGNVTLKSDTKEVREERRYVPVTHAGTENADKKPEEGKVMDKKKVVQDLIASEQTKFTDEHKEWLMTLSEDQLKLLQVEEEKKDPEPGKDKKEPEGNIKKDPDKKKTDKEPVTVEQFVSNAPPEIQAVLRRAVARDREIKDRLVAELVKNERNKFSEEDLKKKNIDELQNLAELARIDTNFELQAGGPSAGNKDDDRIPDMPLVFTLEKEEKQAKA